MPVSISLSGVGAAKPGVATKGRRCRGNLRPPASTASLVRVEHMREQPRYDTGEAKITNAMRISDRLRQRDHQRARRGRNRPGIVFERDQTVAIEPIGAFASSSIPPLRPLGALRSRLPRFDGGVDRVRLYAMSATSYARRMEEGDGSAVRVPDNLGLALGALIAAFITLLVSVTVLAASGGRFWISLGASVCAAIAVVRALRARFASNQSGLDTRHRLGEGVRSLAIVSLLYSGGVLVLNGASLAFAAGGP